MTTQTLALLIVHRDGILTEMEALTTAYSTSLDRGVQSDENSKMAALVSQLEAVNRQIAIFNPVTEVKITGVDV